MPRICSDSPEIYLNLSVIARDKTIDSESRSYGQLWLYPQQQLTSSRLAGCVLRMGESLPRVTYIEYCEQQHSSSPQNRSGASCLQRCNTPKMLAFHLCLCRPFGHAYIKYKNSKNEHPGIFLCFLHVVSGFVRKVQSPVWSGWSFLGARERSQRGSNPGPVRLRREVMFSVTCFPC